MWINGRMDKLSYLNYWKIEANGKHKSKVDATVWINFTNIMLKERKQKQRNACPSNADLIREGVCICYLLLPNMLQQIEILKMTHMYCLTVCFGQELRYNLGR